MSLVASFLGKAVHAVRACQLQPGDGHAPKKCRMLMLVLSSMMLSVMSCAHVKTSPFDLGAAVQLGRFQSGKAVFSFDRPNGSKFCRLIVVCTRSDAETIRASLRGRVVVKRDGARVFDDSFSPETLSECAWFKDKAGVAGYHLHWPRVLDESIQASGQYAVEVESLGEPPASSTVWLFYLPWYY